MLDRLVALKDLDLDGGIVLVRFIVNLQVINLEINPDRLSGAETVVQLWPDLHRADHKHAQTDILGSHRGNLIGQD